jgi:hypothetical protein
MSGNQQTAQETVFGVSSLIDNFYSCSLNTSLNANTHFLTFYNA